MESQVGSTASPEELDVATEQRAPAPGDAANEQRQRGQRWIERTQQAGHLDAAQPGGEALGDAAALASLREARGGASRHRSGDARPQHACGRHRLEDLGLDGIEESSRFGAVLVRRQQDPRGAGQSRSESVGKFELELEVSLETEQDGRRGSALLERILVRGAGRDVPGREAGDASQGGALSGLR